MKHLFAKVIDLLHMLHHTYYFLVLTEIIIDCGNLSPPKYGEVYHSGTGFGAIAHYSCYFGYKLVGDRQRQCTIYGDWSGHTPVCIYIKFQH